MSRFAEIVQARVGNAAASGTLVRNPVRDMGGPRGKQALEAGSRALQHLASTNEACASDDRCVKAWEVIKIAYEGSGGDARTALTQLQTLLAVLTAEDSDVAGDPDIQAFRRRLHKLLDH